MALVSHLDLLRLFDRAVRRAGLPVSFTGGFHPSPRISIAQALSLGVTSCGEIMDFELTEPVDVEKFRQQLIAQLPVDVTIYGVEIVELKAPAATQLLARAEYLITVATLEDACVTQWQAWVEAIQGSDAIWWEQTTKSGKSQLVNLRDRLFELEVYEPQRHRERREAVLRYVGSCRNDGTQLRPEHVVFMLEQVAPLQFQLLHIHRNQLLLH
jgi:radical SAM-linked protein